MFSVSGQVDKCYCGIYLFVFCEKKTLLKGRNNLGQLSMRLLMSLHTLLRIEEALGIFVRTRRSTCDFLFPKEALYVTCVAIQI